MNLEKALLSKLFPHHSIVTCEQTTTLKEALTIMTQENIGAICIVEKSNNHKKLTGIFTERDFLTKVGANCTEELLSEPITSFMTEDPTTIGDDSNIYACILHMRLGSFRHVIIVDENEEPIKMVSIRDAFYYVLDQVSSE